MKKKILNKIVEGEIPKEIYYSTTDDTMEVEENSTIKYLIDEVYIEGKSIDSTTKDDDGFSYILTIGNITNKGREFLKRSSLKYKCFNIIKDITSFVFKYTLK